MKKLLLTAAILLSAGFVFTACSGNNNKADNRVTGKRWNVHLLHAQWGDERPPGKCAKCDIKLVKQKMTADEQKMMNEGTYLKPKK